MPDQTTSDFLPPDDNALCDRCGFAEWRHKPGFSCARSNEKTTSDGENLDVYYLADIFVGGLLTKNQIEDKLERLVEQARLEGRIAEVEFHKQANLEAAKLKDADGLDVIIHSQIDKLFARRLAKLTAEYKVLKGGDK